MDKQGGDEGVEENGKDGGDGKDGGEAVAAT